MSAVENKAVFLSYASQDAEAARRICEALRSAGVEVWFDQTELRGGDAWDTKIRKQIKECALFVPVISANTQARLEGYFRLEWLLAVERSRLMAEERAFLLPVVIDATPDTAASVPDKFREVQWMRLPEGGGAAALMERVSFLLSGITAPHSGKSRALSDTVIRQSRRSPRWWLLAGGLLAAAATVLIFWQPWHRALITEGKRADSNPAPPVSEARRLAARADALFEQNEDASRSDLELAEQLCKQAITLDPNDGEIRAIYARALTLFLGLSYDKTPERRAAARTQAKQAVRLAPTSDEAKLALANFYRFSPDTQAEAEKIFRDVLQRQPGHKRAWRTLANLVRVMGRSEEAISCYQRAIALPGGDPIAWANLSTEYSRLGRMTEAEAAIDQSIALHPHGKTLMRKARLAQLRGDLEAARLALEQVPASALSEAGNAHTAFQIWMERHEPRRAVESLRSVTDRFLEAGNFSGPKDYLLALAYDMMGDLPAADFARRAALQEVEKRLLVQATSAELIEWKAVLLSLQGDSIEARRMFGLARSLGRPSPDTHQWVARWRQGDRADVLVEIKRFLDQGTWWVARLKDDPEFQVLRSDPELGQWLREYRRSSQDGTGKP